MNQIGYEMLNLDWLIAACVKKGWRLLFAAWLWYDSQTVGSLLARESCCVPFLLINLLEQSDLIALDNNWNTSLKAIFLRLSPAASSLQFDASSPDLPPALLSVLDLGLVFTLIGSHHAVRVCAPNKGWLFLSRRCSAAAGKLWTSNVETRQRGGNRKERMDGGGEEGRGKKERGESGLDCKWDSTSTFTRKINMRGVTCVSLCGWNSFSSTN